METNRLRPEDDIKVLVYSPEGALVSEYEGNGFRSIDEAVNAACASGNLSEEARGEDVFEVTDEADGVTSRYRYNAHGNLHLIV